MKNVTPLGQQDTSLVADSVGPTCSLEPSINVVVRVLCAVRV